MRGLFPENPLTGEAINQDDGTLRHIAEMAVRAGTDTIEISKESSLLDPENPTLIIL